MDPLLIDVPTRLETARLILRCPRPGDGPTLHQAEHESLDELRPWMPWAHAPRSPDEAEVYCRRMQAKFLLREDLVMFAFERDAAGGEGRFVAGCGLHRIEWTVRRFEIGYWRRTGCGGQGFVTEATTALARMAFDRLDARRVELRMDDANVASWRIAERCGFTLEALLRGDSLTPAGAVRSTRIYARVRGIEEPVFG
jgi:RimJ/RimL family protein N-acetyltransferase